MGVTIQFPGQGSQTPGMGKSFYDHSPAAKSIFDRVSTAVGRDIAKLCFESDEETLRSTQNAQIALYTVSTAIWHTVKEKFPITAPAFYIGHSVGEYAALACAEVVTVEDGAKLVDQRANLMFAASKECPGTMAAVLGATVDDVLFACDQAKPHGTVVIANDNSPGQIVISGDNAAVEFAVNFIKEAGAKVIPLNVSGAFHSPLMTSAAESFYEFIQNFSFSEGNAHIISNVTAKAVAKPEDWKDLLARQIVSTVQWRETISYLCSQNAGSFTECGPGSVLTGLLKRNGVEKGVALNNYALLEVVE